MNNFNSSNFNAKSYWFDTFKLNIKMMKENGILQDNIDIEEVVLNFSNEFDIDKDILNEEVKKIYEN